MVQHFTEKNDDEIQVRKLMNLVKMNKKAKQATVYRLKNFKF